MGIGETLCRALAKLVMRVAGDQAKAVCGNLQLCAGPEAGIEGATHAMGQRILYQVRNRGGDEKEVEVKEGIEEEKKEGIWEGFNNLNIEMAGNRGGGG